MGSFWRPAWTRAQVNQVCTSRIAQTVEHVLGLYDYRLRVVARDLEDFERVLRRRIMTLPGIGPVEANVLLSEERLPGPL